MGRVLSANASNDEILATLDEWAELLAARRLHDALALVSFGRESTGGELEALLSGGQTSGPLAGRDVNVAAPSRARQAGYAREVEGTPTLQPGDHLSYVGTVRYELALEGEWGAALTAADWDARLSCLFYLKEVQGGLELDLNVIHASALNSTTVRNLIARQFPRPAPRRFPRVTNYDPTVWEIRLIGDRGFLQKHILIDLWLAGSFLDEHVLPGRSSRGLFASDLENLRYLNRGNWANLERVLAAEARPLDAADPHFLAQLCADGPLVARGCTHRILRTPEDMKPDSGFVLYQLNQAAFELASKLIQPPTLSGNAQAGWLLRFWTMHGWMHDKKTLTCQEVGFAPDFSIRHRERVVSTTLFSMLLGPVY